MKPLASILFLLALTSCAVQRTEVGSLTSDLRTRSSDVLVSASGQSGILLPPTFHRGVTWDYEIPMPADNVAFDLETSTNLTAWAWMVTTNQPPIYYDSPNPSEFVRVGTHWIIDTNS
jgi:hypothetical protein